MSETQESQKVAVMNQMAEAGVRAETPLFHAGVLRQTVNDAASAGVVLAEKPLTGQLVLRGLAQDDAFLKGAAEVLGGALPTKPLTSANYAGISIRWTSPDQWSILVDFARASELEAQLQAALSGTHHSVVNVSGAQTIIELSGAHAVDVLKKATSLDVHPSKFPVGKVASSTFAKAGAVYCRTGETSWELVVRRSFANYAWLWLQDAAEEYGLFVQR